MIALAGGLVDIDAYAAFCKSPERDATCEAPPELPDQRAFAAVFESILRKEPDLPDAYYRHNASHQDNRVKAVFVIAPVLGGAFTAAGLALVRIPVKIVVGEADKLAPPKTNAERYARLIEHAELEMIEGEVGHYTFLSEATENGKAVAPMVCSDHPDVDRSEVHRKVSEQVRVFFNYHIGEAR